MSAGRAALAFAAGFGGGYMNAARQKKLDDQRAARDARDQEEHDARMAELRRKEQDRIALADAAKPVTVTDGATVDLGDGQQHVYDNADVAATDLRQARRLGSGGAPEQMASADAAPQQDANLPNRNANVALANATMKPAFTAGGTAYGDKASADAAAAAQNTPEAVDKRVAQAMRSRGDVLGAKQYETASRQGQVSAIDLANKVWKQKVGGAIEKGHDGLAELVSQSDAGAMGPHQLKAVPSADGKSVTYNKVGEDGSLTPIPNLTFSNDQNGVIQAAYMLDRAVDPETRYKNMLSQDKQAAANSAKERELTLRERELNEVKIPNAETRAELARVRADLSTLRANRANRADSGVSREERLRYTTLFTDAGRRMQDASKSLNTMRQDRAFMRRATVAGSPEAAQLSDAQQQFKSAQDERELYRGLLAPSQGSSSPSDGGTKPSLAGATPRNGAKPAAKPGASRDNPVKVTTQAQRDALPRGAYYTAPDGSLRIKQ